MIIKNTNLLWHVDRKRKKKEKVLDTNVNSIHKSSEGNEQVGVSKKKSRVTPFQWNSSGVKNVLKLMEIKTNT